MVCVYGSECMSQPSIVFRPSLVNPRFSSKFIFKLLKDNTFETPAYLILFHTIFSWGEMMTHFFLSFRQNLLTVSYHLDTYAIRKKYLSVLTIIRVCSSPTTMIYTKHTKNMHTRTLSKTAERPPAVPQRTGRQHTGVSSSLVLGIFFLLLL